MSTFNASEYFKQITQKLKATKDGNYKFCRVTGLGNLEDVVTNYSRYMAYTAIDDTNDGYTHQSQNGTYFERRIYTVFVLKKYTLNNMDQQREYLEECRSIYRSMIKKLIKDKSKLANDMIYLQTNRIPFYELEGYAIAGCTGLYFTFNVDIPKNLCYDKSEWYE